MLRTLCVLLLVGLLSGDYWVQAAPSAVQRNLPIPQRSVSRQFVIYGGRKDLVAYAMQRADSLIAHWKNLFRCEERGSNQPIIIRLLGDPTRLSERTPFEIKLLLTDDNKLKIQLDVLDLVAVQSLEFDRKILQAVALRNAYTGLPPSVGSEYRHPPDWIIEAVIQDLQDSEEGDFARSYAAALVAAQNLDLKVFLNEQIETMDAVSEVIYRAKARALLQSLIELPRGLVGVQTFLVNPDAWNHTADSLIGFFPSLQNNVSYLSKVWMLNLARPTLTRRSVPLRMSETTQRLNTILTVSLPEGVEVPKNKMLSGIELIALIARIPKYHYILRGTAQDLLLLSLRAHPIYRPLIDEYRKIVEIFIQNPRKNLDARIANAEKSRWVLDQRSQAIEDYINWFETGTWNQSMQPFQTVLENDQRRRAPAWRSDAISRALDSVEATGW